MFSDTARLLARAMPTGKTVTIPASSLSENGSSYEPTEEEKLYRELLDDVKNRPPHLRIGLESVLPAKDQSPEDWARDMTQQIMARRAANEDKRNLWERFVDTSNFAASLPVRVATKGEYGLGDVLNDQGVSDAEARFAKANQGPLEAVSNLGELAGALPTWEGIGAIPKGILSNALRKAPKMPTASELSRTTFSGGIPEAKAAKIAATGEVQAPIDAAIAKIERRPTSNGFDIIVPSDIPSSPFAKANVTVNSSYNPADSTAYVSNVWVRDDLRRKGVATKLYDEIENMLKTDGKTLVPSNSLKRAGFDFWKNRNPQAVANDLRSHEDAIGEWASKKYGNDVHLEYRDGGQTVDVFKNGRSIDSIGQNELVNSGVIKTAPDPASDMAGVARARVTDDGLSAYEDIANALPVDDSLSRHQQYGTSGLRGEPHELVDYGKGVMPTDYGYVRRTRRDTPQSDIGHMMFLRGNIESASDNLSPYGDRLWVGKEGGKSVHIDDISNDIYDMLKQHEDYDVNHVVYDHMGNLIDRNASTEIGSSINPNDIVNSAGIWDDPSVVEAVWNKLLEPRGLDTVITNDGMVTFNPENVKYKGYFDKNGDFYNNIEDIANPLPMDESSRMARIRSVNAKFDPKNASLSDIMASVAGMFGIPALAASTSRRD